MTKTELKGEEPIQAEINQNRQQTYQHWQMALIQSVEGWRENFDSGISSQTDGVKTESPGGLPGCFRREPAVLVNYRYDWFGQNDQTDRGRNGQEHDEPDGVRESGTESGKIAQRGRSGNRLHTAIM